MISAGWVFFDVDQTLCDFGTMMRRALASSLAEIETRWPELSGRYRPDDLEAIRDRLADRYEDAPVPLVEVRRQMFAEILGPVGATSTDIDVVTDRYLAVRFADPVLFDDVPPCLQILHRTYRLGVITNGNSKLDSLGLDQLFDAEFTAEQVGYAKPDPRIYQYAATTVGAAPEESIMVGDSYDKDVLPPRRLGWRAFWLRRDHADPVAEDQIGDLSELPALLDLDEMPSEECSDLRPA